MNLISSAQNPKFKQLVKLLGSSKNRRQSGQTVLEGASLVKDYLKSQRPISQLLIDESKMGNSDAAEIIGLVEPTKINGIKSSLLNRLSQVATSPGVLAVIPIPKEACFTVGAVTNQPQQIVLVDRIQDPTNLGAIIRSAVAFGVSQIHLSTGSTDPWSPKVIRASAGAVFGPKLFTQSNLSEVISNLRSIGFEICATSPRGDKSLTAIDLPKRLAWLVGNESQGVGSGLLNLATYSIKIPQTSGVESLNLAIASSLCFYEYYRRQGLGQET